MCSEESSHSIALQQQRSIWTRDELSLNVMSDTAKRETVVEGHSSSILLLVAWVLGAVTCFSPLLLDKPLVEQTDEQEVEKPPRPSRYEWFFYLSMGIVLSLISGEANDILTFPWPSWAITALRYIFMSALLAPSFIIMFFNELSDNNVAIYYCSCEFQNVLLANAALWYLFQRCSTLWHSAVIAINLFCNTAYFNLIVWESFVMGEELLPVTLLSSSTAKSIGYMSAVLTGMTIFLEDFHFLGPDTAVLSSSPDHIPLKYISFLVIRALIRYVAQCAVSPVSILQEITLNGCIDMSTCIVFVLCTNLSFKRHLQKNNKSKKQFVRYISHEVRTPLNTILLGLQLALSENADSALPEAEKKRFSDILVTSIQSTETAVSILDDLLMIDKIEEGKLVLEEQVVSLKAFFEFCVTPFWTVAEEKKISMETCFEKCINGTKTQVDKISKGLLYIDEKKMSQVLRNILSNALSYSPEGDVVKVTLVHEDPAENESSSKFDCQNVAPKQQLNCDGVIRIEVHDNGPGISQDKQDYIFKDTAEFNEGDSLSHNGTSSGFGLFICKAIVERHGGKISVSSNGKGSTFSVTLNMFTMSGNANNEDLRNSSNYQASIQSKGKTITSSESIASRVSSMLKFLVVDDSRLNRRMLSSLLKRWKNVNVQVDEACDGQEAVTRVADACRAKDKPCSSYYDAVFMDNIMPVMNGVQATNRIRLLAGKKMPIFAVTGNTLPEDKLEIMEAGANLVIEKPVKMEEISSVLKQFGILE